VEEFHEVVADFDGEHRVVQMHLRQPADGTEHTSSMLGSLAAVIDTV
jgi:hypothetical protein